MVLDIITCDVKLLGRILEILKNRKKTYIDYLYINKTGRFKESRK